MYKILLYLSLSLLVSAGTAYSYPNFIGKGYHNCLTCHYNPFGSGPLNDYGRGVAASAISGRFLINKTTTDEALSNRSGFLFNKPSKTSNIRPSFDYRGATLRRGLDTSNPQEVWINMQMDASITAEFGVKKKYITSFTYSIVPSNSLPGGQPEFDVAPGEDLMYSREHYFGMKVRPNLSVYLGKMDKVFGIRVPDHTAFSRSKTGNNQYGATHGATLHFGKEKFDLGVQAFIGDLEKEKEYRFTGISSKYEHSISDKVRLGVSFLHEDSENQQNLAYSMLTKMAIGKGSSLMLEMGRVQSTPEGLDTTTEQYIFLQNHFYLARGLYFLTTYEQFIPDTTTTSEYHNFAPGIQYFPMQRIELRADLITTKIYSAGSAAQDAWSFLGQVHLWF